MKITIDTKEDSELEIKKAIKLLISLVGSENVYSNEPEFEQPQTKTKNIFEDNSESPNLMGMFDSNPESKEEYVDEISDDSESDVQEEFKEKSPALEFY